mgnify:CR=1 FL=1
MNGIIGKVLNGPTRKFAERHGVVALLFTLFMAFTFAGWREFIVELRLLRESASKGVEALRESQEKTTKSNEIWFRLLVEDNKAGREDAVKRIIEEVRRKQ